VTFNSVPYLVLLVIVVAIYWRLPVRWRRPFVMLASLAFYASWGLIFVWVPLLAATIVFLIGKQITRVTGPAKTWMWMGVGLLLAPLVYFKYGDFLLSNLGVLNILSRPHNSAALMGIAFPIGISFYTFEAIGYLIDLRQARVKMPRFMELCLFFYFWPNVLSGPIVRARELMPQLGFAKPFEPCFVFEGMDRVVWGLVQKNVVANLLGIWVDKGFASSGIGIPPTLDGWFLAMAFALQIYFDFAGYTNMAIGTARFLGVALPENFRQPYHAANPAEFWSRWHMTLSRWIRDYLFFPINAKWLGSPAVLYGSLVGVMGLVGLWHGAGWGFVVWGLLHGCYLAIYRAYDAWNKGRPEPDGESRWVNVTWRLLTLVAVVAAWVPFRAPTLANAGAILSSMFYRFGGGREFSSSFYLFTLTVIVFCALEPMLMEKLGEIEEQAGIGGISAFRVLWRPVLYCIGLLLFLLFDEHNAKFIYSQF
jgi:alginate O-acetyltransferase complex protein AlgI